MAFREGLASAVSDVDVSRACAPHRCAQGALMDERGLSGLLSLHSFDYCRQSSPLFVKLALVLPLENWWLTASAHSSSAGSSLFS